jgi:hypothetical protein
MKALKLAAAILVGSLLFLFTSSAFAHDGTWGSQDDPCAFDTLGSSGEEYFRHVDATPYKGWAKIWFLNLCGDDWGDFHLQVVGKDANEVDFINDGVHNPEIWVYTAGVGLQQITDITVNLSADANQLNMYFYNNPISKLSIGYIDVYTDNTINYCEWFDIKAYPTAVPEPATILLIGLGTCGLLRRRTRA